MGAKPPDVPPWLPFELALLAKQNNILNTQLGLVREQQQRQQQLDPILFRLAGVNPVFQQELPFAKALGQVREAGAALSADRRKDREEAFRQDFRRSFPVLSGVLNSNIPSADSVEQGVRNAQINSINAVTPQKPINTIKNLFLSELLKGVGPIAQGFIGEQIGRNTKENLPLLGTNLANDTLFDNPATLPQIPNSVAPQAPPEQLLTLEELEADRDSKQFLRRPQTGIRLLDNIGTGRNFVNFNLAKAANPFNPIPAFAAIQRFRPPGKTLNTRLQEILANPKLRGG